MAPKRLPLKVMQARKAERLADPEVRRWFDNVARGSLITADAYLRALFLFADKMGTTPQAVVKLDEKAIHALLLDFVTGEEKRGLAGHSTLNYTKAVQSWLTHNGIRLSRAVKVRRAYDTPTLREERTPTQEELKRIFLACALKDRVSAVLMAHSGVRPEVIGNYLGNDGLRLGDFPELRFGKDGVSFDRVPAMVVVRPELSKAGHRYFTFLSQEGCDYLKTYLDSRAEEGEVLSRETDLVHPKWREKAFLRSINVSDGIRLGIRTAMGKDVKMRPYVLRAYFDTQLLLAESRGKVAHDYRVFWMGHKGSMEARYTTNKCKLPTHIIDDMREAYKRAEPFLSTVPTKSDSQAAVNATRVLLLGLKYSEEELAKLDLENLTTEALQELVSRKLVPPPPLPASPPPAPAPSRKHKVVSPKEVASYLEDGWVPVMKLSEREIVLSPPVA